MGKYLFVIAALLFSMACAQKAKKTEEEKTAAPAAASTEAQTKSADSESAGKATCKIKGDERVIEVTKTSDNGCEVTYTKFGESKSVANAQNDMAFCQEKMSQIKGNLESAGFSCE